MPIPLGLTELGDINPLTGFISQLIIAEADGYADEAYDAYLAGVGNVKYAKRRNVSLPSDKGFHPVQPVGYDYNIMGEGENINVPYYTGDASDTKDASGSTTIAGSVMFPAITEGTELIFASLLQALDPESVNRDSPGVGSGTTDRAALNVLAATIDPVHATNNDTLTAVTVLGSLSFPPNPTRAKIEFGNSVRVTGGGLGIVEITGTCQDGEGGVITVTEPFEVMTNGSSKPSDIMSDVYWIEITGVRTSGFSGVDDSNRTIGISVTDKAKVVTFVPNDSALVRFWLMEIVKGVVPNIYSGVIPTGMSFEISRDSAIIFNTSFTGRRDRQYRDLNNREDTNAVKTAINGASNELAVASTEIMTGWQCEIVLNGQRAAFTDGTFNYQPNLTPTGAVSGKRWEEVKPVRATRNVNAELTAIYAPENNFAKVFKNNITIRNIEINLVHSPFGGFPWRVSFIIPQGHITSLPDVETPQGLITQALNIKSFGSGIGLSAPDDMVIKADYSFYNPVRAFTI